MKKRANKNRKKIKDNSFLYTYIILLPLLVVFSFSVFFLSPQLSGKPYFMNNPNTHQTYLKNADWKKQLINHNNFFVQKKGIIFHGDRNKKKVALTFDADMTEGMAQMLRGGLVKSYYDSKMIEVLRAFKTPATLFVTGMWAEAYPQETKDLASDPLFEIGSHSYAHKAFTNDCFGLPSLEDTEKIQDLGTSQFMLQKFTGVKTKLFRFPGGCYKIKDLDLLKKAGMTAIQWDVVANDGFNPNPEIIINNVVSNTRNGSIIVMHMNGFPNEPVDYIAVPQIVKILREKGFEFVTVSTLLNSYDIINK